MKKIDWKSKLTSRKFWIAIVTFITSIITAFGAFVDIGIKQNGLIHVSQMGEKGLRDPSKVLKLNQQVRTVVLNVDLERNRIGLRLLK